MVECSPRTAIEDVSYVSAIVEYFPALNPFIGGVASHNLCVLDDEITCEYVSGRMIGGDECTTFALGGIHSLDD